jgi:hypothetical protein
MIKNFSTNVFICNFYNPNVNTIMFLRSVTVRNKFFRSSKNGQEHEYYRDKVLLQFICDCCESEFLREKGKVDPKRASNNYSHVCDNCDKKRFAQSKGIEKRRKL